MSEVQSAAVAADLPDRTRRQVPGARLRAVLVVAVVTAGLLLAGAPVASAHSTASRPSASVAARPTLKYGSSGPAVKYVQKRLGVRPRSGWFGPVTRAAVKRYQRARGLPASGVVSKRTWAALLARRAPRASRSDSTRAAPRGTAHLNWQALARCESGGNPRIVSRSGRYYGLYQFDLRTWRSVGGRGLPTQASPAEQTYRAQVLYSKRGRSPWPYCGRYL